ncbi:hypothetical protein ACIBBG_32145 [Micromonospora chersina]|uniref:hypothetical protein n=1 Tax=Micromonospora chersina TaxID=47854 RepID=UPI0037981147
MKNGNGVVVDALHTDGQAALEILGGGPARLTVLPARGTFPAGVDLDAESAGALAAELLRLVGGDALQPVAFPSGEQLYVHTCKNVEWWHEPTQGPINNQGCDACESSPAPGAWQPAFTRAGGAS